MDLFVHRKTKQNVIKNLADDKDGREFLTEQLEVFHDIVFELVKPKLIVILNSGVQNFLGLNVKYGRSSKKSNVWLGYKTDYGELTGTLGVLGISPHLSQLFGVRFRDFKPEQETHFLPSSNLTYMSNENKSRLAWTMHQFAYLNNIALKEENIIQSMDKHQVYIQGILESIKEMELKFQSFDEQTNTLDTSCEVHKKMNELLVKYWKFPL